jgi:hypothetical protein
MRWALLNKNKLFVGAEVDETYSYLLSIFLRSRQRVLARRQ